MLYVTNTVGGTIHRFDVKKDRTLTNLRLFAKQPIKPGQHPVGDGIKVDSQGNIYAAAPGGVAVYSAQGKCLGEISLPQPATNLAWGGEDYKSLFITARHEVYVIDTLVSGLH